MEAPIADQTSPRPLKPDTMSINIEEYKVGVYTIRCYVRDSNQPAVYSSCRAIHNKGGVRERQGWMVGSWSACPYGDENMRRGGREPALVRTCSYLRSLH